MKGKIFNAQEVQAIIAGNKTMFREVIKAQPNSEINPVYLKECNSWQWATKESRRECPYQVGQKIFCKESFADFSNNNSDIFYKSDFDLNNLVKTVDLKWKPAQHMKQEQSRITLEITNIKVERLADISEEDARLEGFPVDHLGNYYEPSKLDPWQGYARASFSLSWNPTHKKPEEKFYANPFVWVVDFKINK